MIDQDRFREAWMRLIVLTRHVVVNGPFLYDCLYYETDVLFMIDQNRSSGGWSAPYFLGPTRRRQRTVSLLVFFLRERTFVNGRTAVGRLEGASFS